MPDNNNKFSLDYSLYQWVRNTDTKTLCMIEPNSISIINIALTFYIAKLLYDHNNIYLFAFLIVIRSILDILDGSIARKCNKTSITGKYLDILGDFLFYFVCLLVIYVKVSNPLYKQICIGVILAYIIVFYLTMKNNYKGLMKYLNWYHDNSLAVIPTIGILVFKLLDFI